MSRELELEFLPAALEIEETPPLPLARLMLWSILLFLVIALAWSYIGQVDIVGVAPGKIVPAGRTKTIQPLERSVVKAIRVSEGQHVKVGEVLIELDPTTPTADKSKLTQERLTLELDHARLTKLLVAIHGNVDPGTDFKSAPSKTSMPPASPKKSPASISNLPNTMRLSPASTKNIAKRALSAMQSMRTSLNWIATLPLITEEAESHKKLTLTGVVRRVKWLAVERERIGIQQELAAQHEQRKSLDASLDLLTERRKVTDA